MIYNKKKVECPRCRESFEVDFDKVYVDCPYCPEEFKVDDSTVVQEADKIKKEDVLKQWDSLFKK